MVRRIGEWFHWNGLYKDVEEMVCSFDHMGFVSYLLRLQQIQDILIRIYCFIFIQTATYNVSILGCQEHLVDMSLQAKNSAIKLVMMNTCWAEHFQKLLVSVVCYELDW